MYGRATLLTILVVLAVASTGFAVDADAGQPEPVTFKYTVVMGSTGAGQTQAAFTDVSIPRAEVFYSQYRYVVGIYGVDHMVDELNREGRQRQFGTPIAVYVSDYAGLDTERTEAGLLAVPGNRTPGWVEAERAHYVLGSDARTPSGPAVVPFSERSAARAFVREHGGEVVDWSSLRQMDFETGERTREQYRATAGERAAWADAATASARGLLDRPVSVTVGTDAPTLAAAVEAAPPNTTVSLPPGTYRVGNVTVEKPLTIRGAGNATTLVGDRNGSVVRGFAPGIAVADLSIVGVGGNVSGDVDLDEDDWDVDVQRGYGFGPAGVELEEANGSLVRAVTVQTPANGVVVRWSDGVVVEDVAVVGSETWWEGFMGVMVMESRVVVQDSTFVDGRDGVYTHRGDGSVVRGNVMRGMRFGIHEMYTSHTLLANNTARDTSIGLVVMTRPTDNVLVDNDVRASDTGIRVSGSNSYIAGNVVAGNSHGLDVVSRQSLWEHNAVVGNEVGASAETLLPTNTVVANDFVENRHHALATLGPLRVWGADGRGNYWEGAPGVDRDGDGNLERPYEATSPVDGAAHRVAGADTLALAPGVTLWRSLSAVAPGLRATGIADYAARTEPIRPAAVEQVTAGGDAVDAAGSRRSNATDRQRDSGPKRDGATRDLLGEVKP